ncbi:MAG: (2Fe-2S)-binding protein [Silvanigrellaceae bacterium]
MSDNKKPTLEEIKARVRVVCICKGIKMSRICDAVQAGCSTVEEVNKATGSGNGGCGATRCRPVIEQIIKNGGRPPASNFQVKDDDGGPDDSF